MDVYSLRNCASRCALTFIDRPRLSLDLSRPPWISSIPRSYSRKVFLRGAAPHAIRRATLIVSGTFDLAHLPQLMCLTWHKSCCKPPGIRPHRWCCCSQRACASLLWSQQYQAGWDSCACTWWRLERSISKRLYLAYFAPAWRRADVCIAWLNEVCQWHMHFVRTVFVNSRLLDRLDLWIREFMPVCKDREREVFTSWVVQMCQGCQ